MLYPTFFQHYHPRKAGIDHFDMQSHSFADCCYNFFLDLISGYFNLLRLHMPELMILLK